ncbi:MAG: MFS transporter [Planctomycetota bacterium]|nr:MAG: MFS transporter [Planctomycetota bacterium]
MGDGQDIHRLRDLSPQQWKSGIAAWLGWLFDGLDMHLYTLVALPFVALLLGVEEKDPSVGTYSSIIQAAFLVGWALGGAFFGRIGDSLGRSRALMLTILTYAVFTGLSFFAQTWWHLLICRFLAALGIGGEWAVGAALLSETWPKHWRPWIAAVLQTAVNCGIVLASVAAFLMAELPYRAVFLVGVLPALVTLWIRKAVPETETWQAARQAHGHQNPSVLELFRGDVRRTTLLTIAVCALSLSAHWAFVFWSAQQLRSLPEVASWTDAERSELVSTGVALLMVSSIVGNFLAAWLARGFGYRRTIAAMCVVYSASMAFTYSTPRDYRQILAMWTIIGASSGLFALFTMYMPPLFPTLLRTTGAGFCYNIGRIAAAAGTVFFGLFSQVSDFRTALFYTAFGFLPAAAVAMMLPEPPDERSRVAPVE